MREYPQTDKVRFVDTELSGDEPHLIHTVEVSDERSLAHFMSFYVTGLGDTELQERLPFTRQIDLRDHDQAVFHRDDESALWVDRHFRKAVRKAWTRHFHWRLEEAPDRDSVLHVLDELGNAVSSRLRREIEATL